LDFVRIDYAVVVGVEDLEESRSILHHFVWSQVTVVIAIGLPEPVCFGIVVGDFRAEWLTHRADEGPTVVAAIADNLDRLGRGRGRIDCGKREEDRTKYEGHGRSIGLFMVAPTLRPNEILIPTVPKAADCRAVCPAPSHPACAP